MDFGSLIAFAMTVFLGLFAIMNPVANLPAFIGMTEGMKGAQRKQVAKKASTTAFLIVSVFVILGKTIFSLFGLTIPAFKIAGGILIFMARSEEHTSELQSRPHLVCRLLLEKKKKNKIN